MEEKLRRRLPIGCFLVMVAAMLSAAMTAGTGSAQVSVETGIAGAWHATALPGTPSGAFDINESGVVSGTVGRYWPYNENRAVRWHPDGATEYLVTPTEPEQNHSEALALNDGGQATGYVGIGSYWKEAVIWEPDGSMVRLGWPTGAYDSRASDINSAGAVAAYTYGAQFPFLWRPVSGGLISTLDHPPMSWDPQFTTPRAMNDDGQVVGYSSTYIYGSPTPEVAVVWETGGSTWSVAVLPGLSGGDKTSAHDINGQGQIVGTSNTAADPTTRRPVIWEWDDSVGEWGVEELAALTGCYAYAMNDSGRVVGHCPGTGHAYVWEGGVVTDLGTLPGDTTSWAYGTNENSQIVGVSRSSTNESHAVLWTLETPLEQVADLIALVESYDLDALGVSLTAKLANVQRLLEAGKSTPACQILDAFVNEVEAQSDKGLTAEQAADLIADAEQISDAIGCGP